MSERDTPATSAACFTLSSFILHLPTPLPNLPGALQVERRWQGRDLVPAFSRFDGSPLTSQISHGIIANVCMQRESCKIVQSTSGGKRWGKKSRKRHGAGRRR